MADQSVKLAIASRCLSVATIVMGYRSRELLRIITDAVLEDVLNVFNVRLR
jgi:hypothetical protein